MKFIFRIQLMNHTISQVMSVILAQSAEDRQYQSMIVLC